MGEFLKSGEPVGIGPVIAGWQDGVPVYYVDLLFADGSTKRLTWQKAKKGADRSAKLSAIRERINLAKRLRPAGFGALIHDADSFNVLVGVLSAVTGGKKAAQERA